MLLVLLSALSVFLYVAQQTFSEDKKLFIMDSNRTLLKAATSEIKLELKSRLEELAQFVPRVYMAGSEKTDLFQGLNSDLADELLGVTFYQAQGSQGFTAIKQYTNAAHLQKQKLPADVLKLVNQAHPLQLGAIDKTQGVDLLNRSIRLESGVDVPVLTFVLGTGFIGENAQETFIAVDLAQMFLMRTLGQSELTQVFLLFPDGRVLSHPDAKATIAYASKPLPHPIVEKLQRKNFSRESLELEVDGEEFLCNMSETGFKNVFAVSQIAKSEAFLALRTLKEKSLLLAVLILAASTIVSVFFASGLTTNIQKLRIAAEELGAGNLDVKLHVRSNDEVQGVARTFQWMTHRIKTLIAESVEKGRLEDELKTAQLVQSTLLTPPIVESDAIEMDSHYVSATECGGDYWDARICGSIVTVFIGDATGHGAPAAIVTAVAKSCFATLNSIYTEVPLSPETLLSEMNRIIYDACRGQLLMTMVIVQLNLETGEVKIANAGHESPFCLRTDDLSQSGEVADKKPKPRVEMFFSRGERLGFAPEAVYEAESAQMQVGDTVMLYTDGITEAKSEDGKEWGERALKKALSGSKGQSLSQMKKQITQQLQDHIQGAALADDVTFVLFRWTKQMETLKVA